MRLWRNRSQVWLKLVFVCVRVCACLRVQVQWLVPPSLLFFFEEQCPPLVPPLKLEC